MNTNNIKIVSETETFDLNTIYLLICRGRAEYRNDIHKVGKDFTNVRPPSISSVNIFWNLILKLLEENGYSKDTLQVDLINGIALGGKGET